jgi:hypothetical protein
MANNLYAAASSAGSSLGSYESKLTEASSFESKRRFNQSKFELRQKKSDDMLGNIGDVLSISSKLYGTYEDTMSDVETLEGKYGKMENLTDKKGLEGLFEKGTKVVSLMSGTGEHKFGDTTIKGRDLHTKASHIRGAEAYENIGNKYEEKTMRQEVNDNIKSYNNNQLSPLQPQSPELSATSPKNNWMTASGGLTAEANKQLYEQDPSMKGKPLEVRVSRYKELLGNQSVGTSLYGNLGGILSSNSSSLGSSPGGYIK